MTERSNSNAPETLIAQIGPERRRNVTSKMTWVMFWGLVRIVIVSFLCATVALGLESTHPAWSSIFGSLAIFANVGLNMAWMIYRLRKIAGPIPILEEAVEVRIIQPERCDEEQS